MKDFKVSLDVTTQAASLNELERLVECVPAAGSHDRSEPRRNGEPFGTTRLRLSPDTPGTSFDVELRALRTIVEACRLDPERLPSDTTFALDVAVFFDTAMASLELPMDAIAGLGVRLATVLVSVYPCAPEDVPPEPTV